MLLLICGLLVVLVSSACVYDNERLAVLMMDCILFLILSFSSCGVLYLRDAASLKNCSALNCVSLEVSSCICGMIHLSGTILSTTSDVRALNIYSS